MRSKRIINVHSSLFTVKEKRQNTVLALTGNETTVNDEL